MLQIESHIITKQFFSNQKGMQKYTLTSIDDISIYTYINIHITIFENQL